MRPTVQTLEAHIAVLTNPTELFSEIEQIFPLQNAAHVAAADYGKQVEVEILDGQVRIPRFLLKRLPRLLTHLLNNAITHGIEMPEVRQSLGKPIAGKLTLTATHEEKQVVISFSDDGAGIDVERVKAKAITKKLITVAAAVHLSDLETYEFLFHPDFSTKDIRDMRAGTGYGLDIVRAELKKIGGSISVRSTPGQGTTFTIIYIP
jgi:chemosensory pili system protein ChpA (sensor histidine kinase/response regulator)